MPEKKTICPGLSEKTIGGKRPFPDGQRHGAVRPGRLDASQKIREPFIREPGILSSLKNKRTESQPVAMLAAFQDLFGRKPVAFSQGIAGPYAAIAAVLTADI